LHIKLGRLSALRSGRLYPQEMRPKGLLRWKIPMIPSGFKPTTFRLVVQCIIQLCHTNKHTHTYTHTHAHTRARAHTHAHARTHARARTHTHTHFYVQFFFIFNKHRIILHRMYVIKLSIVYLMFVDPCIVLQFLQKNPTRCNSVSNFYYSPFQMKLNMFRATHRPSSGA